MSEKFWINLFFVFTIVFLGINQFLGSGPDIDRAPFYYAFGAYAAFFAIYFIFHLNTIYISPPAKIIALLTVLAAITFFFSYSYWHLYTMLYGIIFTSVIIFVETLLKYRNVSQEHFINGISFLLVISFALTFFQSASSDESLRYGIGINQACILGLPWIFMLKGWKQKVMFFAALIIAVFSGKRSAIIIFASLPSIYIAYGAIINPNNRIRNFIAGIGIFITGLILFSLADHLSEGGISDRFSGEALQDGSGRGESLKAGISAIKNMNFSEFFLGLDSTSMSLAVENGYLGHNELLGYMLSNGLIGLALYSLLPAVLIWRFWSLHREKSHLSVIYLCCLSALGILSLVSGVFAPIPDSIIWCAFLGWTEGIWKYRKDYLRQRSHHIKYLPNR